MLLVVIFVFSHILPVTFSTHVANYLLYRCFSMLQCQAVQYLLCLTCPPTLPLWQYFSSWFLLMTCPQYVGCLLQSGIRVYKYSESTCGKHLVLRKWEQQWLGCLPASPVVMGSDPLKAGNYLKLIWGPILTQPEMGTIKCCGMYRHLVWYWPHYKLSTDWPVENMGLAPCFKYASKAGVYNLFH